MTRPGLAHPVDPATGAMDSPTWAPDDRAAALTGRCGAADRARRITRRAGMILRIHHGCRWGRCRGAAVSTAAGRSFVPGDAAGGGAVPDRRHADAGHVQARRPIHRAARNHRARRGVASLTSRAPPQLPGLRGHQRCAAAAPPGSPAGRTSRASRGQPASRWHSPSRLVGQRGRRDGRSPARRADSNRRTARAIAAAARSAGKPRPEPTNSPEPAGVRACSLGSRDASGSLPCSSPTSAGPRSASRLPVRRWNTRGPSPRCRATSVSAFRRCHMPDDSASPCIWTPGCSRVAAAHGEEPPTSRLANRLRQSHREVLVQIPLDPPVPIGVRGGGAGSGAPPVEVGHRRKTGTIVVTRRTAAEAPDATAHGCPLARDGRDDGPAAAGDPGIDRDLPSVGCANHGHHFRIAFRDEAEAVIWLSAVTSTDDPAALDTSRRIPGRNEPS